MRQKKSAEIMKQPHRLPFAFCREMYEVVSLVLSVRDVMSTFVSKSFELWLLDMTGGGVSGRGFMKLWLDSVLTLPSADIGGALPRTLCWCISTGSSVSSDSANVMMLSEFCNSSRPGDRRI